MPDTPFKAMGREKRPTISDLLFQNWHAQPTTKCEKCGRRVRAGDWPFCRGNPKDHDRP